MQRFTVGEWEQAELSDMGVTASTTSIWSSALLSLGYNMVRLVTRKNNWTLCLREWKQHRTELRKAASVLCVPTTSKHFRRHDISTKSCSFSVSRGFTAVMSPKAAKRFDRESKHDSEVSTFARFESVRLNVLKMSEWFFVPWVPYNYERTRNKIRHRHSNYRQTYIEQCMHKPE